MPIEVGIWKLGDRLQRIKMQPLDSESKLEDCLCEDLSILSADLMLIGRQVPTDYGKYIDLLAIDAEGDLAVIELKREKTPREVVAQVLDYASWVQNLSFEQIVELYATMNKGKVFEEAFADKFGIGPPEKLNQKHSLYIVASELDHATERILGYLSDNYGVPINAVFFQHFKQGDAEFLTRTWLIDPQQVEAKASQSKKEKEQEPWNGQDFYISFGDAPDEEGHTTRHWDDARRYGFVSGGGGTWYSKTLGNLFVGARVFVNLPGHGYVGVGKVTEMVCPVNEFMVEIDGRRVPILEAPLKSDRMDRYLDDPEKCEYVVRVEWEQSRPKSDAYWEKGLFAIQHTACKLRSSFTIERVSRHFQLDD